MVKNIPLDGWLFFRVQLPLFHGLRLGYTSEGIEEFDKKMDLNEKSL